MAIVALGKGGGREERERAIVVGQRVRGKRVNVKSIGRGES
jgi:hypothetical protein